MIWEVISMVIVDNKIARIRKYFEHAGFENAVIGVSGGKDSAVVLALLVEALGKEHVFGVLVPCGVQEDIDDAKAVCEHFGVDYAEVNIGDAVESAMESGLFVLGNADEKTIREVKINLTSRIRTAYLRMIAGFKNALLVGTTNKSEWYVGYFTKGGDDSVDLEPIFGWDVTHVIMAGHELGVPVDILHKIPSDGLSGVADEDRLGVTYNQIDMYMKYGYCNDEEADRRIRELHAAAEHKIMFSNKLV